MRRRVIGIISLLLLMAGTVWAQPEHVSYMGQLLASGSPHTGPAEFKFAIVDVGGTTTLWSHDGSSTVGDEPTSSLFLPVEDGIFSVRLGEAISGQVPLAADFLQGSGDAALRVWVDTGSGFEQLSDQPISAAAFALQADAAKRALGDFYVPGVVETSGFRLTNAPGAGYVLTSDASGLGSWQPSGTGSGDSDWTVNGTDMYSGVTGNVGIGTTSPMDRLHVVGSVRSTSDFRVNVTGWTDAMLSGDATRGGWLELHGPDGPTDYGVTMSAAPHFGGAVVDLYNGSGGATIEMLGNSAGTGGGSVILGDGSQATVYIDGNQNNGGQLRLSNQNGTICYQVLGQAYASGSQTNMYDVNGQISQQWTAANREWKVYDASNVVQLRTFAETSGGEMFFYQKDGQHGVTIDGDNGGDGEINVYDASGASSVRIVGQDSGGNGRVITDILEIKGGADLSENFDINGNGEVEPGMVVCIDTKDTGKLVRSEAPYERTVAGIVSGAGGVKPGMLMGQSGSIADGEHPVALTGRVWTWCDASSSPIQPGDLLTTSDTAGHAMKVSDHSKANGAILGKAMSKLDSGRGLVLVLVSLQ